MPLEGEFASRFYLSSLLSRRASLVASSRWDFEKALFALVSWLSPQAIWQYFDRENVTLQPSGVALEWPGRNPKHEIRNSKQIRRPKARMF